MRIEPPSGRDLHIYGGVTLLAVGAGIVSPGAGVALGGLMLLMLGWVGVPPMDGGDG